MVEKLRQFTGMQKTGELKWELEDGVMLELEQSAFVTIAQKLQNGRPVP